MMKNKFLTTCGILLCSCFLFACGNNENENTSDKAYKVGFPENTSDLKQFLKQYITSDIAYHLRTDGQENVYAKKNLGIKEKPIEYVQFTDEQVKEAYEPLVDREDNTAHLSKLRDDKEAIFGSIDDGDDLPEITLDKGNLLKVKTALAEEEFDLTDLLKAYSVSSDDSIIYNVVAVEKTSFQIDLQVKGENDSSQEDMSIFMTEDLEDPFVTDTYTDEFVDNLADDNWKAYESLLEKIDSEGRYVKAANSHAIVDTKEMTKLEIDSADALSSDNQYVYLGGNEDSIEDGEQVIQKTSDYLVGNDTNNVEFKLDYKEISETLELDAVDKVSVGKVNYFNENYLVIFLEFKKAVSGTAGSTNIIIDFEEDWKNPTFYLTDLGID